MLRSLQAAGWEDYECLVGCDGPSPRLAKVCSENHDPRIRCFAFPHRGVYGGGYQRNGLMACAQGDLLVFCDDDDRLEPNAFPQLLSVARANAGRPIICKMRYRDGEVLWHTQGKVGPGHVGGSMIVVPNAFGKIGRWGLGRCADQEFVRETLQLNPEPVWSDLVLQRVRRQTDRSDW